MFGLWFHRSFYSLTRKVIFELKIIFSKKDITERGKKGELIIKNIFSQNMTL